MPDILLDLPIAAPHERVFEAVSSPAGLDRWWTKTCRGEAMLDATWQLGFGSGFDWRARVTRLLPATAFELQVVEASDDWRGTRIGFQVAPRGGASWLRFHHVDWPDASEHYRVSCNCWAMYLRILRRHLEHGENVPYERRLDV